MTTPEEVVKEQAAAEAKLNELRSAHRDYKVLQESAAWNTIREQFEEQAKMRENKVILTPLANADAIYEQEFSKGEAAAFRLAARYPALMLEAIESDIESLTQGDIDG